MNTHRFINLLDSLNDMSPSLSDLPDLLFVLNADDDAIQKLARISATGVLREQPDILVERTLEHLFSLLKADAPGFFVALKKENCSAQDIKNLVLEKWLLRFDRLGVSSVYETHVRCGEFLGLWSATTDEALSLSLERIRSSDWKLRMWGARAVRQIDPEHAPRLLQELRSDPFRDDNGYYLVREAAGFMQED